MFACSLSFFVAGFRPIVLPALPPYLPLCLHFSISSPSPPTAFLPPSISSRPSTFPFVPPRFHVPISLPIAAIYRLRHPHRRPRTPLRGSRPKRARRARQWHI
ncbi:hypothetical protein B0H11DRAFT_2111789 [Mycena galericulata]|nr:hypothetical protein B0H11DRAFT_2111789 [Mycena galericulata]